MSIILAEFFGALIITYALTRALFNISKRKTSIRNSALIAFLGVLLIVIAITPFSFGYPDSLAYGLAHGLTLYLPCLILWLIIDLLVLLNKQLILRTKKHNQKLSGRREVWRR